MNGTIEEGSNSSDRNIVGALSRYRSYGAGGRLQNSGHGSTDEKLKSCIMQLDDEFGVIVGAVVCDETSNVEIIVVQEVGQSMTEITLLSKSRTR